MDSQRLIPAVIIALGVAAAGWFVGRGFIKARASDRYVTVKGVAEREVQSDIALWPIRFVATSDNLAEAQGKIKRSIAAVYSFLRRTGIDSAGFNSHSLSSVFPFSVM